MSTQGRLSTGSSSSPGLQRVGSLTLQDQPSWTDDIPVCKFSGVGFSTNQYYREDGQRREEHEFEDRTFHLMVDKDLYLYGVFDGHDGNKVSNFAAQRLPAEIVFGQLEGKAADLDIRKVLYQAFTSVDKAYMDSISHLLAEKLSLHERLPEDLSFYESNQQYPELCQRLCVIEAEIAGGTTAVIALVIKDRLFVANVGCSRALLCKEDDSGVLRVTQLTDDHGLDNEGELMRLSELGLDVEKLQQMGQLDNHCFTRSIGDFKVKCGYKDIELLSAASSEPVIAEPEVSEGMSLDDSSSFLIIMSDGLYKSLEVSTGTEHVNRDLASMVASEFSVQSTLNGVAQAVVDKVVRIHHDTYMISDDHRKQLCQRRDDITLLIRNFNYPLQNAVGSPTTGAVKVLPATMPFGNQNVTQPLTLEIPPSDAPLGMAPELSVLTADTNKSVFNTFQNSDNLSSSFTNTENSTQSSDGGELFSQHTSTRNPLKLDEDGRVEPYVDFSDFNKAIAEMSEAELEKFNIEVEIPPAYEAIPEELEPGMSHPSSLIDHPQSLSSSSSIMDRAEFLASSPVTLPGSLLPSPEE